MSSEFISYTFGKLIEDIRKVVQAGVGGVVNEMIEKKFAEIEEIKARLAKIEKIIEGIKRSPEAVENKGEITDEIQSVAEAKKSEICMYEGCGKVAASRGYCKNHYYVMKRKGLLKNIKNNKVVKRCSVEGCEKNAISRGLCKNHYYQYKRGTIILVDGKYVKKE